MDLHEAAHNLRRGLPGLVLLHKVPQVHHHLLGQTVHWTLVGHMLHRVLLAHPLRTVLLVHHMGNLQEELDPDRDLQQDHQLGHHLHRGHLGVAGEGDSLLPDIPVNKKKTF